MLGAVGSDEDIAVVGRFLTAFNRRHLHRLMRLTTPDQSISLPDGTHAQGRLATGRLIAWVLWRSRGTLQMTPLSVRAQGEHEVLARTRNTARRGDARLDLEMALVFSVDNGRISAICESVDDLQSWRSFWR